MVHYIQVLEQTLAFDQVVLVVGEDNFEEDTVQEDQVCHILEEEDHRVLPVQVEGVGRRSYSMSTLGLLGDLLDCYHARISILSLDRLCYGAFRKYLLRERETVEWQKHNNEKLKTETTKSDFAYTKTTLSTHQYSSPQLHLPHYSQIPQSAAS